MGIAKNIVGNTEKTEVAKRFNLFILLQSLWLISTYYFLTLSFLDFFPIQNTSFYNKFDLLIQYSNIILNFFREYSLVMFLLLFSIVFASLVVVLFVNEFFSDYISLRTNSLLGARLFFWGILIIGNYFVYEHSKEYFFFVVLGIILIGYSIRKIKEKYKKLGD